MNPKRKIPADDTLYYTDNGAIYCGRHLGQSAAYTGRDISGQKIAKVSEADLAELAQMMGHPVYCETCEAQARRTERAS